MRFGAAAPTTAGARAASSTTAGAPVLWKALACRHSSIALDVALRAQRKLLPANNGKTPETSHATAHFREMPRQPFVRVWAQVGPGSPALLFYHTLFKFSNPEEEEEAGGGRKNGAAFECVDESDEAGNGL